MGKVTIKTADGKVYTNPNDIHIPRNEKTEMFYRIVDKYEMGNKNNEDKTA